MSVKGISSYYLRSTVYLRNAGKKKPAPWLLFEAGCITGSEAIGLLQDYALPLPHRSEGVSLPLFCHNSLCRRFKTFRATYAHGYGMAPWRQGAIVGLTLCD